MFDYFLDNPERFVIFEYDKNDKVFLREELEHLSDEDGMAWKDPKIGIECGHSCRENTGAT